MNKNTTIILCQTDAQIDPIYKKWEVNGYNTGIIFKKIWKPFRIFRYVIGTHHFSFGAFIYDKWIDELDKYETVIIHVSALTWHLPYYISYHYPKMRIIMWYWNCVNKQTVPDRTLPSNVEYWSFDIGDCNKYCMKHNIQYYEPLRKASRDIEPTIDIFFIGHDNGRLKEIENIKKIAENQSLVCDIRVVNRRNDFVPYYEVENIVSNSRAILEINQKGQVGLTLRSMEALFYEKKLITNNVNVKNEPFYMSDNIFIIGIDNLSNLSFFIKSPYNKAANSYKSNYSLDAWFNGFNISERH